VLICFAKDISYEAIKQHLDAMDNKRRKLIFGTKKTATIIAYNRLYAKSPMIFEGDKLEVEKRWGKGKQLIYDVV
jgi:hypothetical protein